MANKPPLMDYAGLYGGGAQVNIPTDKWKSPSNVPSDADTGVSSERKRPFKKLFGGLRDKLGSMFGKRDRVSDFDSSDFDVQDPNQVLKLQKELGVEEDGVYGPITQQAHRQLVDDQRRGQGFDAYTYGNEEEGYTSFDAYGDPVSVDGPLKSAVVQDEVDNQYGVSTFEDGIVSDSNSLWG